MKPRAVDKGIILASEIKKAYEKAFGVKWWHALFGKTVIALADRSYEEVDFYKIRKVLRQDDTDKKEYIPESFDCDDYTFSLMGAFHRDIGTASMPIFITWIETVSGGHSLITCYHKGMVIFIEPQTDELIPMPVCRLMLLVG